MKKLLFCITILTALTGGQIKAQNSLTINIYGIEERKGNMYIALFDSTSFMKKNIAGKISPVKNDSLKVILTNIPKGEYAVSIFQDANSNKKFDFKATKKGQFVFEKYGFSNNVLPMMGPPRFEACKFEVNDNATINITLK